jgi:hypothetical protein
MTDPHSIDLRTIDIGGWAERPNPKRGYLQTLRLPVHDEPSHEQRLLLAEDLDEGNRP